MRAYLSDIKPNLHYYVKDLKDKDTRNIGDREPCIEDMVLAYYKNHFDEDYAKLLAEEYLEDWIGTVNNDCVDFMGPDA